MRKIASLAKFRGESTGFYFRLVNHLSVLQFDQIFTFLNRKIKKSTRILRNAKRWFDPWIPGWNVCFKTWCCGEMLKRGKRNMNGDKTYCFPIHAECSNIRSGMPVLALKKSICFLNCDIASSGALTLKFKRQIWNFGK